MSRSSNRLTPTRDAPRTAHVSLHALVMSNAAMTGTTSAIPRRPSPPSPPNDTASRASATETPANSPPVRVLHRQPRLDGKSNNQLVAAAPAATNQRTTTRAGDLISHEERPTRTSTITTTGTTTGANDPPAAVTNTIAAIIRLRCAADTGSTPSTRSPSTVDTSATEMPASCRARCTAHGSTAYTPKAAVSPAPSIDGTMGPAA